MNIVFNDQVYRLDLLATLGGLGHTVLAQTSDLNVVPGSEQGTNTKPVCYSHNSVMYVLSGKVDPSKEMVDVTCVTKHVLRKALASQSSSLAYIAPAPLQRPRQEQEPARVEKTEQAAAPLSLAERTKAALAALSKGTSQHTTVSAVRSPNTATIKALSILEATLSRPQG